MQCRCPRWQCIIYTYVPLVLPVPEPCEIASGVNVTDGLRRQVADIGNAGTPVIRKGHTTDPKKWTCEYRNTRSMHVNLLRSSNCKIDV
jgi:hypothetical protein